MSSGSSWWCYDVRCVIFVQQKTAYEMRISDWSSDVCSSDRDGTVEVIEPGSKLSPVASSLADSLFSDSPSVWSELVNRDSISSNSVKARRDLLHAMVNAEGQEALGFEGFPAERGVYETLLKKTGLHRQDGLGSDRKSTRL